MVKPNVGSSKLLMEAAKERLRANIDRHYEHSRYRTSNAYIESVSRDTYGRSVSATVTVDGVSGYSMKTYGADIGQGERVEVENVSGEEAAPFYQLVGVMPGTATETRRIGGNSYDGLDLLNLAALRVQGSGYIVVGGAIDGDGNPQGDRVELRNYGVLGYATGGNQLTFGLFTGDYVWEEEDGTEWTFNRGDIHLGLLDAGHLLIDNPGGALKWMVGDKELFESKMWNGNPITTLRGWLWIGPYDDSAPGISIGREPGDTAFLFRMYNKFGVPLINFAAGTPDDPYEAYVRIGPPKPFPGLTVDTDDDGNPRLTLDGGTIIAGTMRADSFESNTLSGAALQDLSVAGGKIAYKAITADKIHVGHLSAIVADMGLLTAGEIRVGTGTVGSDFTGLRLYDTGASAYALAGYNSNTVQAYFDTDGKIKWAAGAGILDSLGITFTSGSKVFSVKSTDLTDYVLYAITDSATGYAIRATNSSGSATAIYATGADALNGIIYGFSSAGGVGVKGKVSTGFGVLGGSDSGVGVYGQGVGTSEGAAPAKLEIVGGGSDVRTALTLWLNNSSGAEADGGMNVLWRMKDDGGTSRDAASDEVIWTDLSGANYVSARVWKLANSAALAEYMRLTPTGLELQGNLKVQGKPAFDPGATLTIATGAITVTAGFHFVDTESSAASDDLDTINGGVDGMVLVLRANTSTRTVVCKDGTGNLQLAGDMSLDNTQDSITLMFYSTSWFELSRSDNGA